MDKELFALIKTEVKNLGGSRNNKLFNNMDLDKLQQHSNFVFVLSIFFMFVTMATPISKTIALFVFMPSGILCMIIELYKIFSNK